jgi:hypothetical protein
MLAVPAATPVTVVVRPEPLPTIATFLLLVVHETFWFVAFGGVIVAVKLSDPPTLMEILCLSRLTLVTLIVPGFPLALTVVTEPMTIVNAITKAKTTLKVFPMITVSPFTIFGVSLLEKLWAQSHMPTSF